MEGFYQRVYAAVRRIPCGRVASYGTVALLAGSPRAARIVGGALSRCPFDDVPCHRVVKADGSLPPDDVFGGADGQRILLEMEGVPVRDRQVDMAAYGWSPAGDNRDSAVRDTGEGRV